jgi:energy-coupling factor transport system ATP-binding protein
MDIKVSSLQFVFPGGVEALRGIDISISSGEKIAIIGQNGAGKTTLVRHFNGLLKPTNGVIMIGDWDTRDYSISQLAARVGFVFQNPDDQLFSRTVESEISFGPKNLSYESEKIKHLTEKAIDLTGLSGQELTNPFDLSPSRRKMVSMASILAMDTPILILDEPTTGQDADDIKRIANIVQMLNQKRKTIITITHDIDFCAENFDRIIVMAQGKILLDGSVLDVVSQDELLATTYVDPPQLTRLAKKLKFPNVVKDQESFMRAFHQIRGHN